MDIFLTQEFWLVVGWAIFLIWLTWLGRNN